MELHLSGEVFMNRHTVAIARAVAVIGATSALIGGVTFAALTSNTVKLAGNTLAAASAGLAIGPGTDCSNSSNQSTPGFTNVKLVPGTASAPVPFCLKNTGDVPMTMTVQDLAAFSGALSPSEVTLSIACPTIGTVTQTLDTFTTAQAFAVKLAKGATDNCSATVTLASSHTGVGGEVLNSFDMTFVGNQ
jgi:hypothetical protein